MSPKVILTGGLSTSASQMGEKKPHQRLPLSTFSQFSQLCHLLFIQCNAIQYTLLGLAVHI